MSRKAEKLFQLTNLIRAKQPITAEQIAQELSISTRSVYRYIDDLSVSGIPIYGTAGIGYQMHENFELPPLNLTESELDALIMGVKMVAGWTSEDLSHAAKSLANKVSAAVPKSMLDAYSDVVFAPQFMHGKSQRINWQTVHKSIKDNYEIMIEYNSLNEEKTSRKIFPLGLVYWGAKWTLASWCTFRNDYRSFRVDRIINITKSQVKFQKTEAISLEGYMKSVKK